MRRYHQFSGERYFGHFHDFHHSKARIGREYGAKDIEQAKLFVQFWVFCPQLIAVDCANL